jgi:YD repeat-containing protein
MYVITPTGIVAALDPATGTERWRYDAWSQPTSRVRRLREPGRELLARQPGSTRNRVRRRISQPRLMLDWSP